MFGDNAIVEEDSQNNYVFNGDYSEGCDDSEEEGDYNEYEEEELASKSGRGGSDDLLFVQKDRLNKSDFDRESDALKDPRSLYSKYDQRKVILEEEEKKRRDPNRDFVISSGQDFLAALKCFNPQADARNALQSEQETKQLKLFAEEQGKKQAREHWIVLDRQSNPLRDKLPRWEQFMTQLGASHSKRTVLAAPGSVSPPLNPLDAPVGGDEPAALPAQEEEAQAQEARGCLLQLLLRLLEQRLRRLLARRGFRLDQQQLRVRGRRAAPYPRRAARSGAACVAANEGSGAEQHVESHERERIKRVGLELVGELWAKGLREALQGAGALQLRAVVPRRLKGGPGQAQARGESALVQDGDPAVREPAEEEGRA